MAPPSASPSSHVPDGRTVAIVRLRPRVATVTEPDHWHRAPRFVDSLEGHESCEDELATLHRRFGFQPVRAGKLSFSAGT